MITMGILGKLDKWFERKKDDSLKGDFDRPLTQQKGRRKSGNMTLVRHQCPNCKSTKAFIKNDGYQCTKCKVYYDP